MPKAKKTKRKAPVTLSVTAVPPEGGSKPTTTRTVIRRFHVLIKRKTQLQKLLSEARTTEADQDATKKELQAVEDDIVDLGGLETYQRMSNIGQGNDRGGGSEKIFVGWLNELSEPQRLREAKRQFKLLEVGALRHDNYTPYTTWIDNTPIDLHSRHPDILEQDFLRLNEEENRGRWDLISLSLVVNFVPDAKDRGRMLRLSHDMLRADGYLFLALPLPCVLNSRYMTTEHLQGLMNVLGFTQIRSRWREGGKMAYWLYKKANIPLRPNTSLYEKKVVLRTGNRNNFCVLL
ncbi:hypothetical protein QCA50_002748 [Cerrena zonata]|uniref:25S rRNA adenine-N(1) methyltransferase n=1 Tax=Cerrena zonata TaxID=2478898 RepID=A0AAW0GMQ2_9APHY